MGSERAETYLRNLAESELRRLRGGSLSFHMRHRVMSAAGRAASPPEPFSVTPLGALLELRDGETDMDVYLVAVISTSGLVCLSTGVQSLPKGSRPRRHGPPRPLPRQAPRRFPGWPGIPGVPGDLIAVDDAGRSYDLTFGGGGDDTWSAGQFTLRAHQPASPPGALPGPAWLDVGNGENSVRIDLAARPPAAPVTAVANSLGGGERFLRTRTEALLTHAYSDLALGLPELTAVITALRAVGALPDGGALPGLVAALCDRYAVPRNSVADTAAALPDRWASILEARDRHDRWREAGRTDQRLPRHSCP